jgi:hypothetical protein
VDFTVMPITSMMELQKNNARGPTALQTCSSEPGFYRPASPERQFP